LRTERIDVGEKESNAVHRSRSPLIASDCLVVELGRRVAAGMCGTLLADLGADVVLAEARDEAGPKWRNRSAVAVGKRSVDRAELAADGTLAELVERADVVLLSSDLDEDERAIWDGPRPRGQIVCDITAFGHSGPLAGHGLPEPLVDALGAAVDTTGDPTAPPVATGAPFIEMETAVYAAGAVLAALRARRAEGVGQRIDVAAYDVAVNAMAIFIPIALTGRKATRTGNHHAASSPWNSFAAQDGAVVVCAPTDEQWARLCAAMGTPELASDPRFATTTARLDNVEQIDDVIGRWVAGLTVAEVQRQLEARVIPAGPIVALEELPDEPNIVHRRSIAELPDPVLGRSVRVMPSPIRLAGEEPRPAAIPAFDGDRANVLALLAERRRDVERLAGDPASELRPLAGVRVVEIGMNTVGPLAGRQLGALGADVIKVEPPTGDSNRTTPPLHEDGGSYVFAIANTDKRGIVLDLKREQDAATLWRLLDTADVLIENLKPGSLARLGFGSEDVRARRPQLVYCSVNGFGHDSAYPGRPAFDTVVQAMSGAMSATVVEGVAMKSGLSLSDQLGGQFGLLAILAALERRDRSGEGATLDLAMQDCTAWATQMVWNGCTRTPSTIAQVADGHVAIVGDGPLQSGMRALTREQAAAAHPGLVAPVLDVAEMLAHPQTRDRGLLVRRTSADGGEWPVLESPLRLCSTPARVATAMARLDFLDPALAAELGIEHDERSTPGAVAR
jgi:crotonobetainyl-CoA:carnitine CoA-transferase CaiB-like acyl-CoA transferase